MRVGTAGLPGALCWTPPFSPTTSLLLGVGAARGFTKAHPVRAVRARSAAPARAPTRRARPSPTVAGSHRIRIRPAFPSYGTATRLGHFRADGPRRDPCRGVVHVHHATDHDARRAPAVPRR